MKIEKGKLYYDSTEKRLLQAIGDGFRCDWTNKIAVHCLNNDDKNYVSEKYNLESIDEFSGNCILINEDDSYGSDWSGLTSYYLITFKEFKKFYPDTTHVTDTVNPTHYTTKVDSIVQNVVLKYQERSNLGVKKYGTTLQDNNDGFNTFLNHLQEELMDATLYIEKLKKQFEDLKNHIK